MAVGKVDSFRPYASAISNSNFKTHLKDILFSFQLIALIVRKKEKGSYNQSVYGCL